MGMYDKNNVLITDLVEQALSRPDVIEIKNRTLDGQYHIQSIGDGATTLWVKAHLTFEQKAIVDNIKKTMSQLKVIFDGRYYIGLIDGELGYERIKTSDKPMFTTAFMVAVQEEGVA
jgi:hypothetical protein